VTKSPRGPATTIRAEKEPTAEEVAAAADKARIEAEMKVRLEAESKKLEHAQDEAMANSVAPENQANGGQNGPAGDPSQQPQQPSTDGAVTTRLEYEDEGDEQNEANERELERKLRALKEQGGREAQVEVLSKQLVMLKKKNLIAKKRRADRNEKGQALENFEMKARLCERKRTLESRIATLSKLGMALQVETLSQQLAEVVAKLKS